MDSFQAMSASFNSTAFVAGAAYQPPFPWPKGFASACRGGRLPSHLHQQNWKHRGSAVWSAPRLAATSLRIDGKAGSTPGTDNHPPFVEQCVLVGDIGGTNARLSVATIGPDWKITVVFEKWYPTERYSTFEEVLDALVKEESVRACPPTAACFAVAGPVKNGKGQMTNKEWVIDSAKIESQFGWRTAVINDFEALGYGVLALDESDLYVANKGTTELGAPKVVIGPGTGLGEAQLLWDEGLQDYKVWASEGAHADFAPRGEKQVALMEWVVKGLGYCEVEHVASGCGLERIYAFLTDPEGNTPDGNFPKKAKDISKDALNGTDAAAVEAVDMMLSIVGGEAGHMALRNLARGGVYVAGGITPKVLERVKEGVLQDAFLHKACRFHNLLKEFKLSVVLNEEVGLLGARHYAVSLLNRR